MPYSKAKDSVAALKRFHDLLNAILQVNDDEFDIFAHSIFLDILNNNSRLISLCSGSLQILIDRVKARLEHQRSLKNDQKNDTRCENQSSIEKNEPQNVVTTPMNMADANIQAETASTSRSKRTIKPNPRVEFLLKRKRGMSVDSRSAKNNGAEEAKLVSDRKVRFAMAMKKRLSTSRQTVSSERPAIDTERDADFGRNTNQQMFAKNNLYRTLCVFCNENRTHLVSHYVNEHSNYEVPIARPSPQMADKIRSQTLTFRKVEKKIVGDCILCEENKKMIKTNWEQHFFDSYR